MGTRHFAKLVVLLLIASLGILACDASTLVGMLNPTKPVVTIDSPSNGTQYNQGDEVAVQSTSRDDSGITRVELLVDGAAISSDSPPGGQAQTLYTVVQRWKGSVGNHILSVRAFNVNGGMNDSGLVTITIRSASAATPQVVAPTIAPTITVAPTLLPTLPLSPTASITATTAVTATATRRPATRVPATPTINAPPGIYALSIRVDPKQPYRKNAPTFYVTFLNSTGQVQAMRWYIRIFQPGWPTAKGETSKGMVTIPAGMSEQAAPADWAVYGPGDCEPFFAKAFWFIPEGQQMIEIPLPGATTGPQVSFQVCP